MLTTRHQVDFAYTRPELDALFQYARDHVVERGGRAELGRLELAALGRVKHGHVPEAT
jgi:hypothetical protein